MEGHAPHSKRKRMLSNIYAKSTLQNSQPLTKQTNIIINDRLYPRLKAAADSGEPIELYDVFSAVTMDFVSGYIFGMKNGSDFIQNVQDGITLFHDFKARQKYTFWPQELVGFTNFMKRLGLRWLLVPTWVDQANNDIEAWLMNMCDTAEKTMREVESGEDGKIEDYPTVYAQLRNSLIKATSKESPKDTLDPLLRLQIASELLDHTLAGFDTSSITLTWLAWQLSLPKNRTWQENLHHELISPDNNTFDAKILDSLSILHAILMESLRLHTAIPGNQPRLTPSSKNTQTILGDTERGIAYPNLPPNIRVQSQAYSLHRNPSIFPDPEVWDPSRWLNPTKDMNRWFWAFGSGGRMCVGSNLAMLDMKVTMKAIWGKFRTDVVRDEGMVANGGYMAEPLGIGPGGRKGIGKGRDFLICRVTVRE